MQGSVGQHQLSALFHGELLAGIYGSDCFATQFSGALVPGLRLFWGGAFEMAWLCLSLLPCVSYLATEEGVEGRKSYGLF